MKNVRQDNPTDKSREALRRVAEMAGPEPVMPEGVETIPVCQPTLKGNERKYVIQCMDTNWISSRGRFVDEFEKNFSHYCGVRFGITTNSGTTALHLALATMGIGEGDEAIIPSFTMISTANAIAYLGAKPVVVDVEPDTWNIDPDKIEEKITEKTRVIIPIHTYGHPANMDRLEEIAKKHGLEIVEDAAEAHGAEYKGRRVGSFGKMASFSFYANKIITTGEGGMIVTDDPEMADRLQTLRNYGFTKERHFWHKVMGFSYRMTNLQAAIGLGQFERIEELIQGRIDNARLYNELLRDVPGITTPRESDHVKAVYWMYGVLVEDDFGISKDELRQRLADHGIETRSFFIPIHLQPIYSYLLSDEYPISEELGRKGFYLPSASSLRPDQIEFIVDVIRNARS
ncbi:MAG: DegT/DnrJ/EryC1/StrS family aminotransferase [Candidatus Euphemobacter frigidus]|nr:DegT/DnrJ/EryC1/StrS family aminotransferase [Candidatus Euphemobacter frigidus]MDP8276823.1 DegT/DnrJ/EryC1/StrS family aminotransferase [Candidatus Euphemobacter frigidus]